MKKILVAGAHGTTGKKIVSLLKESDQYEPIAMVRKKEQQEAFEKHGTKAILADLEQDVSEATKGMGSVIFAAGSSGKKVKEVDQKGAIKLMDASKENSIRKFVMLSAMGADKPKESSELKEYLMAKHNADAYLKECGITYTIVRSGALTNDSGNGKVELETKLNKRGKIPRADVAQTLIASLGDDMAKNKTFEILEGDTYIKAALEQV